MEAGIYADHQPSPKSRELQVDTILRREIRRQTIDKFDEGALLCGGGRVVAADD